MKRNLPPRQELKNLLAAAEIDVLDLSAGTGILPFELTNFIDGTRCLTIKQLTIAREYLIKTISKKLVGDEKL
ncbi:MAG: hypothetical protein JW913_16780 [Chitinispirillaceae bacterium]|nr:hypothetical protein [Chitinispirillaceae bacterium]